MSDMQYPRSLSATTCRLPVGSSNSSQRAGEYRSRRQVQSFHSPTDKVSKPYKPLKQALRKAAEEGQDPSMALLRYSNTPLSGLSIFLAQLLISRMLRDKLPVTHNHPKKPQQVWLETNSHTAAGTRSGTTA